MAENFGSQFSDAFGQQQRIGIADRAQQFQEDTDRKAEAEKHIQQLLGVASNITKAASEAGRDPMTIAGAIQPVAESAAQVAAGVYGPEGAARVQGMFRALLARPPLQDKSNIVPVPTNVDPYTGERTYRGFDKNTGKMMGGEPPAATPSAPKPTPMNLGTVTGISIDGQPTEPSPNERVAQTFDENQLPKAAAPVQSTARARAADIPVADPKAQFTIDRGMISRENLDYRAELYLLDQSSIKGNQYRGKEGGAVANAIINRANEIARARGMAPGEILAQGAMTGSSKKALDQIVKVSNAIETFENTALKNGAVLVDLAKKVDTTGIPALERWIRAGRQNIAGDVDVSNFNTQMTLFRAEAAKILTNPNLTGVLTDESRKEVAKAIQDGASFRQVQGAYELLKRDFQNRRDANQQQIDTIMNSFSNRGRESDTRPAAPARSSDDLQRYKEKYGLK